MPLRKYSNISTANTTNSVMNVMRNSILRSDAKNLSRYSARKMYSPEKHIRMNSAWPT